MIDTRTFEERENDAFMALSIALMDYRHHMKHADHLRRIVEEKLNILDSIRTMRRQNERSPKGS